MDTLSSAWGTLYEPPATPTSRKSHAHGCWRPWWACLDCLAAIVLVETKSLIVHRAASAILALEKASRQQQRNYASHRGGDSLERQAFASATADDSMLVCSGVDADVCVVRTERSASAAQTRRNGMPMAVHEATRTATSEVHLRGANGALVAASPGHTGSKVTGEELCWEKSCSGGYLRFTYARYTLLVLPPPISYQARPRTSAAQER
mmetsp:Transcript_28224/g.72235  ORF Transcript_28224/g.72235 Transcript_28224/m.72235 type:complete len:208 (-) Transcript_28224:153-776(-)